MNAIPLADIVRDPDAFLRRVEAGEEMVLTRDAHPVAEVKPIAAVNLTHRPYGLCAGEFVVPDDFDAPLPEDVIEDFEGR